MTKHYTMSKDEISILIIEDEAVLALGLEYTLKALGYGVCGIESRFDGVVKNVSTYAPDLVLVDIKLSEQESGISIAKYIWQTYKIPIIFLTSYCDEKTIKEAMACEPYGYVVKPWKDAELNAIIQMAMNKHNYFFAHQRALQSDAVIFFENGVTYHKGKSILYKDEEALHLTGNETKLLDLLSEYPKEAVSFERISSYIWRESLYDLGRLRTLVYRLKQKIGINIVESVFEMGYRLKVAS